MSLPRKASFVALCSALMLCVGTATAGSETTTGETGGSGSTDRSVGKLVDDSVITAKVKSALIADDDVKAFDISVKTRQGNVMLSGFVDSPEQARRAVELANNVDGVKAVSNQLTVKN